MGKVLAVCQDLRGTQKAHVRNYVARGHYLSHVPSGDDWPTQELLSRTHGLVTMGPSAATWPALPPSWFLFASDSFLPLGLVFRMPPWPWLSAQLPLTPVDFPLMVLSLRSSPERWAVVSSTFLDSPLA